MNDNKPIRLINQPFYIVRNSYRLLTPDDLWFHDPDITNDDYDVIIERRAISNGEIVNATTKEKVRNIVIVSSKTRLKLLYFHIYFCVIILRFSSSSLHRAILLTIKYCFVIKDVIPEDLCSGSKMASILIRVRNYIT